MVRRSSLPQRGGTEPRNNLYPYTRPVLIFGSFVALIVTALLFDVFAGFLILCLAVLVGQSWRADMLPIIPFVLTYQWIAITAGYFFQSAFGHSPFEYDFFPGSGDLDNVRQTLLIAMIGLFGLLVGVRIAMRWFSKTISRATMSPPSQFSIQRSFVLSVAAFSIFFVYDIAPKSIWFGGAQIIYNLLSLRFIPYFILLLAVFRTGRGYSYAVVATIIAILPELLTGFSRFKEILFVVMLAALAEWRPWLKTSRQRRRNRKFVAAFAIGGVLMVMLGLIWTGGLKQEWRNAIWYQEVSSTPIDRMVLFFDVAEQSLERFDIESATEGLASRLSSGTLYFSNVIVRVPDFIPYEQGEIFLKAIKNVVMPRFLFPEKADLGGDSWLVRKYAGLNVSGDESQTSIGLGYMAEFYIDFGVLGVVFLTIFYGLSVGMMIALFARVAPYKEVFMAMTIGTLLSYFMSADGSFIKLYAGLLQRGIITAFIMSLLTGTLIRYLEGGRKKMFYYGNKPKMDTSS